MPTKKQLLEENAVLHAALARAEQKIELLPQISLKRYEELKEAEKQAKSDLFIAENTRASINELKEDHQSEIEQYKILLENKNEIILNLSRALGKIE